MSDVLIIDDDHDFSGFLRESLEAHGHRVDYVDNVRSALELLERCRYDLILLDNRMPGISGLEALEEFRIRNIETPVIMMTGEGTSDVEIQAWIRGVFDYVEKPLDIEEIEQLVENLEPVIRRAEEWHPPVQTRADESAGVVNERRLLYNGPPMKAVLQSIAEAAKNNWPVLVLGETGTGKDLVARAIHDHSPRRDRRFIPLNVPSLTESLIESQLFGHEASVATGMERLRKGYFEDADGGTLFLDEIGEMPLDLQSKLLRVVEEGCVYRIGSTVPIPVDVRIVSATNRDLRAEVAKGTFREDLYYRLAKLCIDVPPLRERGDDLALLGRHFRIRAAHEANRPVPQLDPRSVEVLRGYFWPGNVRELRDVLTRAVVRCRGDVILPEHLGLAAGSEKTSVNGDDLAAAVRDAWASGDPNLQQRLHDGLDRELIRFALEQCGGNQTQVADRLGLSRNTVRKLVQKYCLEVAPEEPSEADQPEGQAF